MASRAPRGPLFELTWSRIVEFYRDPGALFWVFGMPLLLAIALGLAFRNKPPDATKVVVVQAADADATGASSPSSSPRSLLSSPLVSGEHAPLSVAAGFDAKVAPLDDARLMLKRGQVDVLIDVSASAAADPRGALAVTYRYDETRPEGRYARLAAEKAIERWRGRTDVTRVSDERVTEAGSRYIDFLLPGLIGMNLLGSSMWGIGYSVVDARKRKLLKRLAATPMKRHHYLGSLMLSRFAFLVAEVTALVLIGRFAFGVVNQGSYGAVAAISLVGGLAFTGLSLLIAARPASTEVASGLMNLAMLPMYLLSGSFFSSSRFPDWLQPFVQALPLTAFNDALRAVINEGASLSSQWSELAILAAWGVVPFVLALRLFRWQ